jgi:hypothetical protein
LHRYSLIDWIGAVARPNGDGWTGLTVRPIAPHPLELGKRVWELARGGASVDDIQAQWLDGGQASEGESCTESCAPNRVRWVYVIGEGSFSVLVAACFKSGVGVIEGVHHFRHEPLLFTRLADPEPDWQHLIELASDIKRRVDACPEQRRAL